MVPHYLAASTKAKQRRKAIPMDCRKDVLNKRTELLGCVGPAQVRLSGWGGGSGTDAWVAAPVAALAAGAAAAIVRSRLGVPGTRSSAAAAMMSSTARAVNCAGAILMRDRRRAETTSLCRTNPRCTATLPSMLEAV